MIFSLLKIYWIFFKLASLWTLLILCWISRNFPGIETIQEIFTIFKVFDSHYFEFSWVSIDFVLNFEEFSSKEIIQVIFRILKVFDWHQFGFLLNFHEFSINWINSMYFPGFWKSREFSKNFLVIKIIEGWD